MPIFDFRFWIRHSPFAIRHSLFEILLPYTCRFFATNSLELTRKQ